jgi:hypothetical protein
LQACAPIIRRHNDSYVGKRSHDYLKSRRTWRTAQERSKLSSRPVAPSLPLIMTSMLGKRQEQPLC